ncbi:hypothetical protein DSECCO2_347090 [anaerobic digester metagenome]
MVGRRQVQPRPPGLQGEEEDRRPSRLLETLDHLVALLPGRPAVQVEDGRAEPLADVGLEDLPELRKLREDEGTFARIQHLFEHLQEARDLSGPSLEGGGVVQKKRRVVAYLL